MIDLKALRQDPDAARAGLRLKGADPALIDRLLEVDERRRETQHRADDLRAEQKVAGREMAGAGPERRDELKASMTVLKADLKVVEEANRSATADVDEMLLEIPNLPHESVPEGRTDEENEVFEVVGETMVPDGLESHDEIGRRLGIVDMESAARVSGSRFAFVMRDAVRVQLALEGLALDLLSTRGFVPVIPPVMVREDAMFGTGFLPTDRAQIYETAADDLYLVGTSEVPLAALHSDEILPAADLPVRYVGLSTCFRREAGTHGKDTKGIFRVHQFDKVEMFSYCHPDRSWEEHEMLLAAEREIYDTLGFAYRIVNVCGGDLGASAAKKYDIEAWLPSEGRYREITSTSNTTDYQSRRLRIRVRDEDGVRPLHTLNGTAIAIGRCLVFMLEQFQEDGRVRVPNALVERGAPEWLEASG